jgi:hypothetical protein
MEEKTHGMYGQTYNVDNNLSGDMRRWEQGIGCRCDSGRDESPVNDVNNGGTTLASNSLPTDAVARELACLR